MAQKGEVKATMIGYFWPIDGWSLTSYRRTSGAPSYIRMFMRSSSLLSRIIANRRTEVDSRLPRRPRRNRSSSYFIMK